MKQKKDSKNRNLRQGEDQLKDGRYRYRYTDKYGNRKAVYSWKLVKTDKTPTGKKDGLSLRELEKSIERDINDGIQTQLANTTSVYLLTMKYIATKPRMSNATRLNYLYLINNDIKNNIFGSLVISDVKKSDVKKFYAYLYEERKLSINSIHMYHKVLLPAFQLAVDDDLIRKNPCKGCIKDYPRKDTSKTALTKDEQIVLLDYVKNSNTYKRYYALIAFMLSTGCRVSETIGLTWNDLNLEEGFVSINHQIIYKKVVEENKIKYYAEPPKNRTFRVIPLQKDIITILSKYKTETYFMSKTNDCTVDGYSNFVFLNRNMNLYTPVLLARIFHNIRNSYNKTCGDIILPDFTPHIFRHTFCTRMAENGMDVKVLQEIMGHKTINITMQVYNHVLENRARLEVDRVPSALLI